MCVGGGRDVKSLHSKLLNRGGGTGNGPKQPPIAHNCEVHVKSYLARWETYV